MADQVHIGDWLPQLIAIAGSVLVLEYLAIITLVMVARRLRHQNGL